MSIGHVIVVEDEPKIARLVADYLENDGFQVTVLHDGTSAVERVKDQQPDFLIIDLMLPGKDGLTICKEVRQFSSVPIMMLTAKTDEIDRLVGLELGADDYVCKPFSPREVLSRVRAILRRVQGPPVSFQDNKITYRSVTINEDRYECVVSGQNIDLTPVEFRMLKALLTRPGHVYSREKLIDLAYEDNRVVSDRTIDTHVKNLRRKIAGALGETELIQSIYGVGYKID